MWNSCCERSIRGPAIVAAEDVVGAHLDQHGVELPADVDQSSDGFGVDGPADLDFRLGSIDLRVGGRVDDDVRPQPQQNLSDVLRLQ